MQIHISTSSGIPIYLQIVKQVKLLVASGRIPVTTQLPPVRKLAQDILVNPNTVARAYKQLEMEKVILSRRGAGVFVADAISPLAKTEQQAIMIEHIDGLLAEAGQMDMSIDEVISLIHTQNKINKGGDSHNRQRH